VVDTQIIEIMEILLLLFYMCFYMCLLLYIIQFLQFYIIVYEEPCLFPSRFKKTQLDIGWTCDVRSSTHCVHSTGTYPSTPSYHNRLRAKISAGNRPLWTVVVLSCGIHDIQTLLRLEDHHEPVDVCFLTFTANNEIVCSQNTRFQSWSKCLASAATEPDRSCGFSLANQEPHDTWFDTESKHSTKPKQGCVCC